MLDDEDIPPIDWDALRNVYVIANGKGGVGKTTLASNLGGLVAADGARVLVADINGQGNVGRDLGYRQTDVDDEGAALYEALRTGSPFRPVPGIRRGLDVVVGGAQVGAVPEMLQTTYRLQQQRQALALAVSLAPIARQYDIVFLDSAPENPPLQQLALSAARWMIAPTKSDKGSINDGLGSIARQFALVRRKVNPQLQLLGVVLFASGSASTQIRKRARDWVAEELGTDTFMFESAIRHAEAVGVDARARGQLVHELEEAVASNPKFWDLRAGRVQRDQMVSATSASVAEDFANLAREVLTRAAELEAAA
ncbi:ParA family protein [Streptomyces scabiei]|uniref:ParA family protein n=1 Tax=Streptomyces scabiei TaxID=1930 RepID=UPI001B326F52|nr:MULTISPECIES: ParA family protein [Streptomyces]MBP5880702.1 ParA family protein [Streptomyces sp. LBUM 1477]MDX2871530.1 ParA family protein [Streptomyces scabiei]MDX3449270.1 ParA family protein [Streptomyces scabiei]MDX3461269.1 ParA family protein [Streptomyces scabiei]